MNNIEYMNLLGSQKKPFIFIIDFDINNIIVRETDKIDTNEFLYKIKNHSNSILLKNKPQNFFFEKKPPKYSDYKIAFDNVMHNLYRGNSYLTNLTLQTEINTNLSLKDIFYYSEAPYKLLYKDEFVVFSPETFIEIRNGKIYSYPMKGTIDAGIDNAEEIILNDEKELAEHRTIVDLIRNDLSIIAKNVKVNRFRYISEIKTNHKNLLQVSSEISGELDSDYSNYIGTIISKLLPAGSISGAPKKKTVEIIKESENYSRGFYTGIFGIFDGENLDSGVMIRFIEQQNGKLFFKSGGGITYKSKPETEYQELIDKVYVPFT